MPGKKKGRGLMGLKDLAQMIKNRVSRSRENSYSWRDRSLLAVLSVVTLGGFLFCFVIIFLISSIRY